MQNKIIIVPEPKKVVVRDGFLPFKGLEIAVDGVLSAYTTGKLSEYVSPRGAAFAAHIDDSMPDESYTLRIGETGIEAVAGSVKGLHYAVLTLIQIIKCSEGYLPYLEIEDGADFACRGFMLDISRGKVPTRETLFRIVDFLSDLKVNMLQLYVEGRAFYYPSLNKYYSSPDDYLTAEDVVALKEYARERYVDLVPCGNSYGHMTYWLNQEEFRDLAHSVGGFDWSEDGLHCPAGTLNPQKEESLEFVKRLFDEMLPPFEGAELFNIGGDEPFDTLFGEKKLDDDGETYFNFIGKVCDDVRSRGLTPMMWGDVAHNHPDKLERLGDVVFLEWRYDAGAFNDEACKVYADKNKRFIVCPSSSLCNNLTGKTDNMLANIREAAFYGKKYGAEGLLNTEWGDGSYAQTLALSFFAEGVGACYAWNAEAFNEDNLKSWLDSEVYGTSISDAVADLGRYINLQTQPIHMIPYLFSALYIRGLDCMQVDYDDYSDPTAYFRRDELLNEAELKDVESLLDDIEKRLLTADNGGQESREAMFSLSLLRWAVVHTRVCRGLRNNNPDESLIKEALERGEKCLPEMDAIWYARNKKSDHDLATFRYHRLVEGYKRLLKDIRR